MTVIGRGWSRLTLPGKVVFIVVPLLFLLTVAAIALIVIFGQAIVDILVANLPIVRFVVAVTVILVMTIPTAFLIIYMEMKIIALMNLRIGPDRVGPFGSLLSVVHGLKVLMKEDFTPTGADSLVFTWAPVVVYLASVLSLLVIPFAPGLFGLRPQPRVAVLLRDRRPVGGRPADGRLVELQQVLAAGRAARRRAGRELRDPAGAVGRRADAAGRDDEPEHARREPAGWFTDWYIFQQPLGALIFFIAATAEANRTPFDLTEADSEIVAGFATEYSGMRFGFFFFAEYVNVFIVSALFVTLFLGGWNAPFPWPWPVQLNIDPASFNIGLLFILGLVPVVLTLLFGAPVLAAELAHQSGGRRCSSGSSLRTCSSSLCSARGRTSASPWVAGILWFMLKTYTLVFTFVWMRGTLPRVRIDQLMDFAWKWLLPASLLNLFVTAGAIVVIKGLGR